MQGRGSTSPRLPPIAPAAAGNATAAAADKPTCPACGRTQFVAAARCICGHVPYIDTLDDAAKREVFLANRRDAVGVILARKRRVTLARAMARARGRVVGAKPRARLWPCASHVACALSLFVDAGAARRARRSTSPRRACSRPRPPTRELTWERRVHAARRRVRGAACARLPPGLCAVVVACRGPLL